jgi:predicted DNA-binding protein with PD1-like motif
MYSNAKIYVIRLRPQEDLKRSILAFALERKIKAAIILTCIGSLEQFHIRFANQKSGTRQRGHFEILHCGGTISESNCHLHLTVADETGTTFGGHLLEECLIYTTAEIAIAELSQMEFLRIEDPTYGYRELVVKAKEAHS